ncbi:hypothetical protein PHET_10018 [Paragonimus heterotremus]|uniref:SAM domain-containing protein n=1 Tax=Paragonimus heterotremus TaxID=100268 RepID=A0A8J4WE26_9TREM|nr:hypothetical protein PHET_10018 [Paragonimus heterotremus]
MVRKTYAQIFVDHRITDTVVADLDKEHLKDMGITVVGDVIAILKQCKKVGHEDPSLVFPTVSSTTSKMEARNKPGGSLVTEQPPAQSLRRQFPPPPRRLPPADEGGYIVKHPTGTTAKTRRILASLKQRATSTTQIKQAVKIPKKTTLSGPQPNIVRAVKAFDDSDMDESDGYRVIISKKFDDVTPSGSVFARLGALTETSNCPSDRSLGNLTTSKRLIERNIPAQSSWSPLKSTPWSMTSNVSLHPTSTGMTRSSLSSTTTVLSRPVGSSVKRQVSCVGVSPTFSLSLSGENLVSLSSFHICPLKANRLVGSCRANNQ